MAQWICQAFAFRYIKIIFSISFPSRHHVQRLCFNQFGRFALGNTVLYVTSYPVNKCNLNNQRWWFYPIDRLIYSVDVFFRVLNNRANWSSRIVTIISAGASEAGWVIICYHDSLHVPRLTSCHSLTTIVISVFNISHNRMI